MRVLFAFLAHADGEGRSWPGVKRLESNLGVKVRNIRRARAGLIKKGILLAEKTQPGRPTIWKLLTPELRAQGDRGIVPESSNPPGALALYPQGTA